MISRMRVLFLVITGQVLDDSWSSTGPRLQACILRISQVAVCTRDVECIYTHIFRRPKQQQRSHFDSILPQIRGLVLTMAQRYNLFSSESENEGSSSGDIAPALSHVVLPCRSPVCVKLLLRLLVVSDPQCFTLLLCLYFLNGPEVSNVAPAPAPAVSHVVPASVDGLLGCAVSYVAPAPVHLYDAAVSYVAPALVDGFSGPVTFSAPVENVAPAPVVTSTPALSGESCFDELRGATEVPTVRFRLHDEWLHAERVLRARAARRGYFFR